MQKKIELLNRLIAEGEKFTFDNFSYPNASGREFGGDDKPEWLAWKTRAYNLIQKLTDEKSPSNRLAVEALAIPTRGNYDDKFNRARATFLNALRMTATLIEDDSFLEGRLDELKVEPNDLPAPSNKVFVVHGHDQALKIDVERFIHQIGLEPIVLHRQPDKGQTIIEKFEEHSDVGYAFILLTPDEVAYTIDQEKLPDASRKKELRTRPNVIFEFGFFVGKLGRQRVCCIYKEGVVLPSDLTGLIYKKVADSIDSQAYSIIQELKAAGYKLQI